MVERAEPEEKGRRGARLQHCVSSLRRVSHFSRDCSQGLSEEISHGNGVQGSEGDSKGSSSEAGGKGKGGKGKGGKGKGGKGGKGKGGKGKGGKGKGKGGKAFTWIRDSEDDGGDHADGSNGAGEHPSVDGDESRDRDIFNERSSLGMGSRRGSFDAGDAGGMDLSDLLLVNDDGGENKVTKDATGRR